MKRKLIFLVAVIIVSILTVTLVQAKGTPKEIMEGATNFNGSGGAAYPMKEEDEVGVHFHIAGDALFVGIGCPSWSNNVGDLTVSLYAFEKDYATSISKDPILSHEFHDFEDNALLGFEFSEEDPLKTGQYVIVLSDAYDPGGNVGLWVHGQYPGQHFYEDGEYNPGYSARMKVKFKGETPEVPYGELGAVDVDLGNVDTSPYPFLDGIIRFSDPNAETYVDLTGANRVEDISIEDGKLKVEFNAGDDPYFVVPVANIGDYVPCDKYPIILIRVKLDENSDSSGEIFFNTTEFAGPTPGGSVGLTFKKTTEWQTVIANFSANKNFKGDLISMRFDIANKLSEDSTYLIDYILFFGTEEAALNFKESDFEILPTPEPTTEPTPTPEATEAPEVTEEPKVTKAPSDNDKDAKGKGNLGLIIGIVIALIVIVVVVVVIILIKKKKAR